MKTRIYYNPRCSKCRQTLALLRERGIEPEIIHYLDNPPSRRTISTLLRCLGDDPRVAVRFKEPLARELGLSRRDERSRTEWAKILAEHPALLERPIVVHGDRAALGRPPENVMEIL
ncbi:MAG: arsenate reductase (glutaredoxin) [Verrucomicrobia bacterium]|nr:MAG: arsenate reductase (glutaredoxin) [Verrucomicrobiota bacterium]